MSMVGSLVCFLPTLPSAPFLGSRSPPGASQGCPVCSLGRVCGAAFCVVTESPIRYKTNSPLSLCWSFRLFPVFALMNNTAVNVAQGAFAVF